MRPGGSRLVVAGLALSLCFGFARPGLAWGPQGHRVIATIAERILARSDPAIMAKIRALLATDTDNDWTRHDIADEAVWADVLREKSPEARTATTDWHYIRLKLANPNVTRDCFGRPPLPAGYPASRGPENDCIIDKITEFEQELHSPSTFPSERLIALKFLLNLVGDLHDPLYTIDHGDRGGRCTAISIGAAGKPVRLLTYWDEHLVSEVTGHNLELAAAHVMAGYPAATLQQWAAGSPADWARESYAIAKTVAYGFTGDATAQKYRVPAAGDAADACGPVDVIRVPVGYETTALAAVKQQLAKAGFRLALVLRENFK